MTHQIRWLAIFAVSFGSTLAGQTEPIDVPFLPQMPPPQTSNEAALLNAWHRTKNCGQTSVLMVMAKYSQQTPTSTDIMNIDTFLQQQFMDDVNGYLGS